MKGGMQMVVGRHGRLVRLPVGNYESALREYLDPTGKRGAGKLACPVWSGGKIVRSYLSLEKELD